RPSRRAAPTPAAPPSRRSPRSPKHSSSRMAERFLTARIDGQLYAMAAGQGAEGIRVPSIAPVPQAPKGLLVFANLRGTVVPVASLRGLLGREEKADATTRAIVLDDSAPVALAVDAVEALVTVDEGQIETR